MRRFTLLLSLILLCPGPELLAGGNQSNARAPGWFAKGRQKVRRLRARERSRTTQTAVRNGHSIRAAMRGRRVVFEDMRGRVVARPGADNGPTRYRSMSFLKAKGGKLGIVKLPVNLWGPLSDGILRWGIVKPDGSLLGKRFHRPRAIPNSPLVTAKTDDYGGMTWVIDARSGKVIGKYGAAQWKHGAVFAQTDRDWVALDRDSGARVDDNKYVKLVRAQGTPHLLGEHGRAPSRSNLVHYQTGRALGPTYRRLREERGVLIGAVEDAKPRAEGRTYSLVDPGTGQPKTEPLYTWIRVRPGGRIIAGTGVARYELDRATGRPVRRIKFESAATVAEIEAEGALVGPFTKGQ